jgi:hypothetical protein
MFGAFLEDEMFKRRTPWWREAHFEVKFPKHLGSGSLLGVEMFKKCMPSWREAQFEGKICKEHRIRTTFGS